MLPKSVKKQLKALLIQGRIFTVGIRNAELEKSKSTKKKKRKKKKTAAFIRWDCVVSGQ